MVCSPKARPRRCKLCRMPVRQYALCDFVVRPARPQEPTAMANFPLPAQAAKTCDAVLCRSCAVHVEGLDKDYCPLHAAALGIGGRKLRL